MAIDVSAIQTAYYDNASYKTEGSVAKCKLFIDACRRLLGLPKFVGSGGQQMALDPVSTRAELIEAERWLASSVTPPIRELSFENFRR